jgi:hypothetical protein
MKHFILKKNHKPFEWLTVILNVDGSCEIIWIDVLQYFGFKIVHRPKMKHGSVT